MLHILKRRPDAALALEDGTVFRGFGTGRPGSVVGELVFHTGMTGYQEILTDPSYAGQIVTFTFPHIGIVGTNEEDVEAARPAALGMVCRQPIGEASNWRAREDLASWLERHGLVAIFGLDTRRLTRILRDRGFQRCALAFHPDEAIDGEELVESARAWPGMVGLDLVPAVTCREPYEWREGRWDWPGGYRKGPAGGARCVVLDYGVKRNILRSLVDAGFQVTVVPGTTPAEKVLAMSPDAVLLSNGPGDPAATGRWAVPEIRRLVDAGVPLFGICLGHQMLALAMGARTEKMRFGHHGANHPVADLETGRVEITSQNHGFAVAEEGLPNVLRITHRSLFDGTIQGLAVEGTACFSVQFHPEASPGPHDSHYLFERFAALVRGRRT
ncbi:Carbamoyl-phosphate synthase small chain [bacterium HR40]|nr:Carbamoyl-phosphate synthase small chain [bacterium HR40]